MCRPRTNFVCADCQSTCVNSNYAIRSKDEAKICDDCAFNSEVESIRSGDRWTVYGPDELKLGESVTNWTGGKLGSIIGVGSCPHPFTRRGWFGPKYHCNLRMVDGSLWSGWIGEGIASNIKRKKSKA